MSDTADAGLLRDKDIAVIGMAGRFPDAPNLDVFWQNLKQGHEAVTPFSDAELLAAGASRAELDHPDYVKAGVLLPDVERFDASFFGYTPGEAELMDPQQRLFLEHAWEALEHAGYTPHTYDGLIGVYAGVAWNTYLLSNLTSHPELFGPADVFQTFITNDKDFMPTRVSYKLNLRGPSIIIQTSCSTSLVALHLACLSLQAYECDMALVGGVTVKIPQVSGYMYREGGLASPDGHCRTFDAEAQGTIFGSGIGVVVLKRAADAVADRDTLHAVIKGSAINNDGSLKVSYTAPSVDGQAEVIAAAQATAEVEPETISYIEAHGTATALGDPIEVTALTKVFRAGTAKKQFCAIGSVKSNHGHLDAAAGIAGFIKTVLALKHRQIPPSLHYQSPNPKIDLAESPFYVNSALADWTTDGGPRRAGVSSFGVGGTNAHIILEEAPTLPTTEAGRPWQVLPLSARTDTALEQASANLAAYLRRNPETNLADIAYTLQVGRTAFRHRRVIICRSHDDALQALERLDPAQVFTDVDEWDRRDRPVVFLFPGQGAQYAQMARDLYQDEPIFREQLDRCAELLRPHLGLDLRDLLYPNDDRRPTTDDRRPEPIHPLTRSPAHPLTVVSGQWSVVGGRELEQTQYAQPALFAVEYALAQLWMAWGVRPQAMLGHSIGEYVAACLAGVFTLEDALALVAERGRLMQSVPEGAMLSVALPEAELLVYLGTELSLAAVNGPAQCVVAGPSAAIEALEEQLNAQEVTCRRLRTSHAFHSAMMDGIVERFAAAVGRVARRTPQLPYISNVSGSWITLEEATDPHYWARHLRQPVRFAEGLAQVAQGGTPVLLEVGPGTSLTTLARRQAPAQIALNSLRHPQQNQPDSACLLAALGRLWLAGAAIDWASLHSDEERRRLALPTYPFERQRYWIERAASAPATSARHRSGISKTADVADWFYLPSWKRSLPPTPVSSEAPAGQTGSWLIFMDSCGLGEQLAGGLTQLNQTVVTVEAGEQFRRVADTSYIVNPLQAGDITMLLDELRGRQQFPGTIAYLWGVTASQPAEPSIAGFDRAQTPGFYGLLSLIQALGTHQQAEPLRIGVISNNMQSVAGEAVLYPEKATLLGLCKVIPQEYPHVACRSIDIILPEAGAAGDARLIDLLIAEINAPAAGVVAYRDHQRWVETFEPLHAHPDAPARLRDGGVYLITGGLSGLGAVLAESLAHIARARLVLVEEAGFPERAEWAGWLAAHPEEESISQRIHRALALEQQGATILALGADVTIPAQVQTAISRAIDHFGELHGVIHAAGVAGEHAFRAIQELSPVEAGWHFAVKAHATLALAEALRGTSLDFCCLASSLSSLFGGRGYAAFTAANRFMDAFAQAHNRCSSTPWMSINWDAWRLAGETDLTAMRSDLAQLAMEPAEIGEVLRRAITLYGADQVIVSTGDLAARLAEWDQRIEALRERTASTATTTAVLHPRPRLPTNYVAPANEQERIIAAIWQQVLGFEQVGVQDNFFELGGDSLIAIRVMAQLKATLGVDIPAVKLYQSLTIRSLAEVIAQDAGGVAQRRAAQLEGRIGEMERRKQYQQMRRSRKH